MNQKENTIPLKCTLRVLKCFETNLRQLWSIDWEASFSRMRTTGRCSECVLLLRMSLQWLSRVSSRLDSHMICLFRSDFTRVCTWWATANWSSTDSCRGKTKTHNNVPVQCHAWVFQLKAEWSYLHVHLFIWPVLFSKEIVLAFRINFLVTKSDPVWQCYSFPLHYWY